MEKTVNKGSVDFIIAVEGCSKALLSYFPHCSEDGVNRIRIEAKSQDKDGSTKDKIERSLQVLRFCPEGNAILVVGGRIYDNPEYLERYQSHLNSEHFDFCTIDGRRRLINGNLLPKNSPEKGTVIILNLEQFNTMLQEICLCPRHFKEKLAVKVH